MLNFTQLFLSRIVVISDLRLCLLVQILPIDGHFYLDSGA